MIVTGLSIEQHLEVLFDFYRRHTAYMRKLVQPKYKVTSKITNFKFYYRKEVLEEVCVVLQATIPIGLKPDTV